MAILNAANEIAVDAFLQQRIGFNRIAELIESTLNRVQSHHTDSLQEILQDDRMAREFTRDCIEHS
jgi:1-deoxy-D-xylulose-5-phosphate reductoisomerase